MKIEYDDKTKLYSVYIVGANFGEWRNFKTYEEAVMEWKVVTNPESIGRNKMKHKLRAECLLDAIRFTKECYFTSLKIEVVRFPDCTVEFEANYSIEELKKILKAIPDSHVMLETLAPLAEYTGERKQ